METNSRSLLNYQISLKEDILFVRIAGRLDYLTVSKIWAESFEQFERDKFNRLIVDAKGITYCDSVGVALLFQYKSKMAELGGECSIEGLQSQFQELLGMIHQDDFVETSKAEQQIYSKTEKVGIEFVKFMSDIKFSIHFIGEISFTLLKYINNPFKIKWV